MLAIFFGPGGCQSEPTKSQYVSARVREECVGLSGNDARTCRIEVIKRFSSVSLAEMKAQFPPPEKPDRPSCSLW